MKRPSSSKTNSGSLANALLLQLLSEEHVTKERASNDFSALQVQLLAKKVFYSNRTQVRMECNIPNNPKEGGLEFKKYYTTEEVTEQKQKLLLNPKFRKGECT